MRAAQIEIDEDIICSSTTGALAMAAAGLGITFLPEWIEEIADNEVVIRRVEDMVVPIPLGIGWRADSPVPGILPFVEYARLATKDGVLVDPD